MNFGDNDFWTIIASVGALLSAIYAFQSNRISRKALRLALKDYQSRSASFSLYLIDGYRWNQKDGKRKFLFFHCTISNKSNSKSSYKATLEIEYIKHDDTIARVVSDHQPSLAALIPQELSVFPVDIRIEEQVIESKWLIFEQLLGNFRDSRIDHMSIKLTDPNGNTSTTKTFLVKDFIDEN